MTHEHNHKKHISLTFDEKLVKLLEHWIKHNDDHAENYRDWAKKTKEKG
ncbi:MAG: zinc transporter, partial [Deltaproteobacteria bacterium]|nr:zinc transporter [Deltaproteobacteria bacterium]